MAINFIKVKEILDLDNERGKKIDSELFKLCSREAV